MAAPITSTQAQSRFIELIDRNLTYWLRTAPTTEEKNNIIQAVTYGFQAPAQIAHERAARLLIQSYPLFESSGINRQYLALLEISPSDIRPPASLTLINLSGMCYWKLGSLSLARKQFTHPTFSDQKDRYPKPFADSLYGLCLCEIAKQNLDKAKQLAISALRYFFTQKRIIPIVQTQNALSVIYLLQGHYKLSEQYLRNSLDILFALSDQDASLISQLIANLGILKISQGNTLEGLGILGEVAQNAVDVGDSSTLMKIELNRAYQHLRLNNLIEAKSAIERSLRLYLQLPDRHPSRNPLYPFSPPPTKQHP